MPCFEYFSHTSHTPRIITLTTGRGDLLAHSSREEFDLSIGCFIELEEETGHRHCGGAHHPCETGGKKEGFWKWKEKIQQSFRT